MIVIGGVGSAENQLLTQWIGNLGVRHDSESLDSYLATEANEINVETEAIENAKERDGRRLTVIAVTPA